MAYEVHNAEHLLGYVNVYERNDADTDKRFFKPFRCGADFAYRSASIITAPVAFILFATMGVISTVFKVCQSFYQLAIKWDIPAAEKAISKAGEVAKFVLESIGYLLGSLLLDFPHVLASIGATAYEAATSTKVDNQPSFINP